MTESEIIAKNLREQCAEFLTDPTLLVELEEYYNIPSHISENQYNEWLSLHSKEKVCHFMKDQWPIYHPKIACLLENNSVIANKFKAAYLAGYAQGMAYCIEDLELREESFLKNYSPEYLESILYFYNKKEVSLIEGVQKGSVYVKSYVPTKGMPEVLYEYGFHSCVVWYIENLMEKFPNKFSSKSIKKESNKTTLSLTEIAVYCRYRDIWVTKNQNPRDIPELKKILGNRKGNGIPGQISKLPNKKEWYRSRGSQQKDENFRDHLIKVYQRFKTDGRETEADNVLNDINIFCNKHHLDNLVIDNLL